MTMINTKLQNLRIKGNLDKNEYRPSRYGALELFMNETDNPAGIITSELKEKAISSIGRTIDIPVIDYDGDISIGSSRSVTISDSENTSQIMNLTFVTYAWGFTQVPSMFTNNEYAADEDFRRKMVAYINKFAATLDLAAITKLAADKTQVFNDTLDYSVVGNSIQCPWKLRENVIGDLDPLMSANDYFNEIHLVGNGGMESIINKLAQKGLYNEVNKQMEYAGKILHFTPRITNDTGKYATFYGVAGGMVGLLTRFEREAVIGRVSRTGHEWGIDNLPGLNFPIGTYYYESVGDYNAINGDASADLTRAWKQHYGFAVDVAFVTAYNSDPTTLANPIMKVEVAQEAYSDYEKVVIGNTAVDPVYTRTAPTPTPTATPAPTPTPVPPTPTPTA